MFDGEILVCESVKESRHEINLGPAVSPTAWEGTVNGERAIIKKGKISRRQVWLDQLKPAFGLQRVGMSYLDPVEGPPIMFLKYHNHFGTLSDWPARAVSTESLGDFFLRVCLYDFVVGNGDRHSNNVLVIDRDHLLAIDEAMAIRSIAAWGSLWSRPVSVRIGIYLAEKFRTRSTVLKMYENIKIEAYPLIMEILKEYAPYISDEERVRIGDAWVCSDLLWLFRVLEKMKINPLA